MSQLGNCTLSEAQVAEAFIKAPPLISETIRDLSLQFPSWIRDNYKKTPFPNGHGTEMQQLIFRGALPQIERGFQNWRKLSNNSGCNDCAPPDCSYNWKTLGGNGMERKVMELMDRDFKSPSYCVKEIQTSLEFEMVMGKIIENLWRQVDFEQEINIGFNALTSLAKKYVIDSTGPRPNTQNPYVYRPVGTVRLSALNIEILQYFYEWMRKIPDVVPLGVTNGQPVFSMIISPELLSRLYRDDPQLRQDVRFSGAANALVEKYNFISSVRDMFLPVPYLWPRRFNVVNGELVEVFPTINNVPLEVGAYTDFNPAYEQATHEEIVLHGRDPFEVFYKPTVESLGGNTSFGPESAMFDNWQWINPQTVEDPARRVGFFMTNATIGISQQYSEGIFGIVVERPRASSLASFYPEPECPPVAVECDNEVAAVGCPCPQIISVTYNPVTDDYLIQLGVPTTAVAEDEILLGVSTGGYITATVVDVSADGLYLTATFSESVTECEFTEIFCVDTLECSALVTQWAVNCADGEHVDLVLSSPIKAVTAADVVVLNYGDGTQLTTATVVSVDLTTNTWVVDVGAAFCNRMEGIYSICVPTATDASCPGCDGPSYTVCTEE